MRRMAWVAGALTVLLCVSATAAAQGTKNVRGEVTAITADSITVKVGDRDMTFKVDKTTTVTARGAGTATREARAEGKSGVALNEIVKPGQGVEVAYHENGMHAASVRVLPSRPGPPPPAGARATTASGVVSAVTGSSLTVKETSGESTYSIDGNTKVIGTGAGTKSKAAAAAGQKTTILDFVSNGDTVQVRFTEQGGSKRASEVRVTKKGK